MAVPTETARVRQCQLDLMADWVRGSREKALEGARDDHPSLFEADVITESARIQWKLAGNAIMRRALEASPGTRN